jgi:hypothetical protein
LIKEAIEKILSLAAVEKMQFGGRDYTSKAVVPVQEPALPLLEVNTLRGLVGYLTSGFDGAEIGILREPSGDLPRVALHIVSPTQVEAFCPVEPTWKKRVPVVRATWDRRPFPFGSWLSQEDFVIGSR